MYVKNKGLTCSINGCTKSAIYKKMCNRHYQQIKSFGNTKRTMFDKNTFVIIDNIGVVFLYNRKGQITGSTMIDADDVAWVMDGKWCLGPRDYIYGRVLGRKWKLHQFIMGVYERDGYEIDHINRNKTDNRKKNLRYVPHKINCRNQEIFLTNKSGYRGVSYHKKRKYWIAGITVNGKHITVEPLKSREDAIRERQNLEQRFWKDETKK